MVRLNAVIAKSSKMVSLVVASLLVVAAMVAMPTMVRAHCEIPCGIYHDEMRFDLLSEHIETIDKSMTQITELSAAGDKNYNQLVRWVVNKEDHADKYMEVVTQYFLTQRIPIVDTTDAAKYAEYQQKVTLLHQMIVYAMKCKQTTDKANVARLTELQVEFKKLYFKEHGHTH